FCHDDISSMSMPQNPEELLIRLPGSVRLEVSDKEAFKAANGYVMPSVRERLDKDVSFALLENGGKVICIYSVHEGRIMCQVRDE
ncbi:MAG: hypothetical protein IKP61_02590, partial [Spirochaetales bacterium]|nr:hypothetical protein [Spirochaetales bacterium]